ncbi:tetratricopeptide repeat protein [Candidatus Neomarinimicrobiota bacterium]
MRFWDLYINPLEFRTPVLLAPFDVKGSLTVYGGQDIFRNFLKDFSVVILDSTESEMQSIQSIFSRLTLIYDLDLVKFNPLYRISPLSMMDLLAGVGLRTNQIPISPDLPGNWPSNELDYRFAPVFHQGVINLTFGYQRSESWYAYLQLSRGVAVGSVYRASVFKRYLKGSGTSADFAAGIKFFRPGSGDIRYSWGGELRYARLDVPELSDPDRLSPIEGIQTRYLGFFFTFGTVLGGRSTSADQAKRDLYRGDYMAAEENLRSFLDRYPQHGKVGRAKKLLELAEGLVPYQQIDLARALQEEGRLEEALRWLDRAEARADSTVMPAITQGRAEVGYVYLQRAENSLRQGNLDQADQILRITKLLLPVEEELIEQYEAEILVRQGHNLRAQGALTAALRRYNLAITADTSRRIEIEGYQVRIAEDLLRQAETASSRDAIALALESLRLSQSLDPRRKIELDKMIVELNERLERLTRGEIRRSVEDQMQEARELLQRIPSTMPRIGLLVAQIEDILGPPDHVTQETDRFGVNHQLWEYESGEYPGLYYFENYILTRVETIQER